MKSSHLVLLAPLVHVLAACSSSTTAPASAPDAGAQDSGSAGPSTGPSSPEGGAGPGDAAAPPVDAGRDANTDGFFQFAFTSSGANVRRTDFGAGAIMESMYQPHVSQTCSLTGTFRDNAIGCSEILNVAFVGEPAAGASFPLVVDPTTPPGKGEITYTETCDNGATRRWKATGGTIAVGDALVPTSPSTGWVSLTVTNATMAPDPTAPGDAQGNFTISGSGKRIAL